MIFFYLHPVLICADALCRKLSDVGRDAVGDCSYNVAFLDLASGGVFAADGKRNIFVFSKIQKIFYDARLTLLLSSVYSSIKNFIVKF